MYPLSLRIHVFMYLHLFWKKFYTPPTCYLYKRIWEYSIRCLNRLRQETILGFDACWRGLQKTRSATTNFSVHINLYQRSNVNLSPFVAYKYILWQKLCVGLMVQVMGRDKVMFKTRARAEVRDELGVRIVPKTRQRQGVDWIISFEQWHSGFNDPTCTFLPEENKIVLKLHITVHNFPGVTARYIRIYRTYMCKYIWWGVCI